MRSEPRLAVERERLRGLLVREQSAQDVALAATLDVRAADRMATRILDRARQDDDRTRLHRPVLSPRRRLWTRLLALSVGAHVLALGVLSWRHFHPSGVPASPEREGRVAQVPDERAALDPLDRVEIEPADLPLPGAYVVADERLPVEDAVPGLVDAVPASEQALAAFPRGSARAMWVRSSDSMKRLIEARVGSPGSLDRVKTGLRALGRLQADDGSFADATGAASVRTTATVLLAFLSDGHSSRGGEHRAVLERGIAWLVAQTEAVEPSRREAASSSPAADESRRLDRALGLFALSEDLILSSGELTPGEARFRRVALTPLATSVASARRAGPADRVDGARSAEARWTDLALAAAERAGLVRSTMAAVAVPLVVGPGAFDDARTAMLDGTAILRDRHGSAFSAWNAATSRALAPRIGADGLVSGPGSPASRAEETALVLLALQVAHRTY